MCIKNSLLIFLLVVVFIAFSDCDDRPGSIAPFIESIEPPFGFAGNLVTIKGTRFNANKALNTVLFNKIEAEIESATENQIVVKVPLGSTGNVSVITSLGKHVGPLFTYRQATSMFIELKVVDLNLAIINLNISAIGTETVSEYGVIYSTSEINSINDGIKLSFKNPISIGNSKITLSPLLSGKKYFVKPYTVIPDTTILSDEFNNTFTFTTGKTGEWFKMTNGYSSEYNEAQGSGLVLNGKGYFSGGMTIQSGSKYIPLQEFDFANYKWTKLDNCPAPYRDNYSYFGIGDTLYFGWGYNSTAYKRDTWKYNVKSKIWINDKDFPLSVFNVATHARDGKGYLLCLYENKEPFSVRNKLFAYDPLSGQWTEKAPPPFYTFASFTSFNVNNKLFVLFGVYGGDGPISLWEYDMKLNSWTKKSDPPMSGRILFSLTNADKAYVIYSEEVNNYQIMEYRVESDSWSVFKVLPWYPDYGVAFNNSLYFESSYGVYKYTMQ